jgi:hypothetical protein
VTMEYCPALEVRMKAAVYLPDARASSSSQPHKLFSNALSC